MNNLEITAVLELAVIAIAVAQALTILLTIRRERDVKELRELVDQQRLRIVELRAWFAGRKAVQPSRIKSQSDPIREPTANNTNASEPAITSKDLPDAKRPSATEDELKRATKPFKWFKEDADEPREIVGAREIFAGLKGGPTPLLATAPKDLPDAKRPSTTEDELKRVTKTIDWLKEDADKAKARSQ